MKYVLIAAGPGHGRFIMELDDEVMVVAAPDGTDTRNMIHDPADNPQMSIIPLIEQLEWQDDDLPDADSVEAAGLDVTLRGGERIVYSWRDVALTALSEVRELQEAVRAVEEAWEGGDLAGAVTTATALLHDDED